MRRERMRRLGLVILQHMIAACILFIMAFLLLNSYIAVETIDGTEVYKVFPVEEELEFEDSEIYRDLFKSAVSDITQLVVLKAQMETDDVFDGSKLVDITAYANRMGIDTGCNITTSFELDDLIKWGKYGVTYSVNNMTVSQFVHAFGDPICVDNFCLDDEYETDDAKKPLRFKGFLTNKKQEIYEQHTSETVETGENAETDAAETGDGDGQSSEFAITQQDAEKALIERKMAEYTREQLEDLVFYYIVSANLPGMEVSNEGDRIMVSVSLLNSRYKSVRSEERLPSLATNWVDYLKLQNNIVSAIEKIGVDYQRYLISNKAYSANNSNIKYMIRMVTADGMQTYTNVNELKDVSDEDVTEYFSEFRRYVIYYPDSLEFMGNTVISEDEIYQHLNTYAYPDTTHIWFGVDTGYNLTNDVFYNAHAIYNKFVPNIGRIMALAGVLFLVWIGLCVYLSVTAGVTLDEAGNKICVLNRFDKIWTEAYLMIAGILVITGVYGSRFLIDIAAMADTMPTQMMGIEMSRLYSYLIYLAYGAYLSISFTLLWYSLIRRIKAWNLWNDSLMCALIKRMSKIISFILRHRNAAISILIPYNMFLFINLLGGVVMYRYRGVWWIVMITIIGLVLFDGMIGVIAFRRQAEQKEIVDGINRIRDGEVEFNLDEENLHGSSKDLAMAVNKIGEGIRKAVKTSMKDEQMKTDLITNVSHDIKTPLTSIINYVDLLKRLKIQEEPAKDYIAILDNKAHRLKQLTDDLVEASKISSGNIILNMERINITELLNQSVGEFSEKLEAQNLTVIFENADKEAYILADSRRMWRVIENLFNNICKYALEGTRVYLDVDQIDHMINVSVKNISRQKMNIKPDELTERFIRGDSARSTEGSGLGLSIAKSLVQVQGGEFSIYLDGDLFKITLTFPVYKEQDDRNDVGRIETEE